MCASAYHCPNPWIFTLLMSPSCQLRPVWPFFSDLCSVCVCVCVNARVCVCISQKRIVSQKRLISWDSQFLRYDPPCLAPMIIPRTKSLRLHFGPRSDFWSEKQLNLLTTSACLYAFSCCHMIIGLNICINKLVSRAAP